MGTGFRVGTAGAGSQVDGDKRPMTAVKAAGFQSAKAAAGAAFDPLKQGGAAIPSFDKPPEESPDDLIKAMEKKAHTLLEESAFALEVADNAKAVDKAKEAVIHDRMLCRQRETLMGADVKNDDLTFSILFHLAQTYERCGLDAEAITAYNTIIKNKVFDKAARLRINLGKIIQFISQILRMKVVCTTLAP